MKSKNLIVYFPGYTGLPKSKFNPLLRKFRRDGFETYSVKYNLFGRGDMTELAREALNQIGKLDTSKYDTVTFIGHSMGGLVARRCLKNMPSLTDYLITLGSPHRGLDGPLSALWRIGGKSPIQMKKYSIWSQYCDYPEIPTLAITGEWDFLVRDGSIPLRYPTHNLKNLKRISFMNEGKQEKQNLKIPRTTHLGLITNYRTYGEIYAWLVYEQLNTLSVSN